MSTNAFYASPASDRNSGGQYVSGRAHGSGDALHGSPRSSRVHLTPRQREVLRLLCEGLPNKLICRRLNISAGTVKAHISSILRELGVTSRLQAVVAARRLGFSDDYGGQHRPESAHDTNGDAEDADTLCGVVRTGTR